MADIPPNSAAAILARHDAHLARQRAWDAADAEWGRVAPVDPFAADGGAHTSGVVLWNSDEIGRLFGFSRVLLDALIPASRAADGSPLHHPGPVVAALTDARAKRVA